MYSVQHLDKGRSQVPLFPALGRAQQPPFPSRPPEAHRVCLLGVRICDGSLGGFLRKRHRCSCRASLLWNFAALCAGAGRVGQAKWARPRASRQPAPGEPLRSLQDLEGSFLVSSPRRSSSIPTRLGKSANSSGTIFFSWQSCCRQEPSANTPPAL